MSLKPSGEGLTVVGDEDQSIYSWRGADLDNILDFEHDFPGARVFRLEQNYRSSQAILDAASSLVARNQRRKGKTLHAVRTGGEPVRLHEATDEFEEAAFVVERIAATRGGRGRVAALDLGARRIGVAYSDSRRSLASPWGTIVRSGDAARDRSAVVEAVREVEASTVVVGLPLES